MIPCVGISDFVEIFNRRLFLRGVAGAATVNSVAVSSFAITKIHDDHAMVIIPIELLETLTAL